MSAGVGDARVLHSLRGRVRVHLATWSGEDPGRVVEVITEIRGVIDARANSRTRNVLVRYDACGLDHSSLLAAIDRAVSRRTAAGDVGGSPREGSSDPPDAAGSDPLGPNSADPQDAGLHQGPDRGALDRQRRQPRRARIAVRGMDRNPELARRVVQRLEAHPHVTRASASPLTGRVLVEVSEALADFDELVEEATGLEVPDAEPLPAHPLDAGPLIEASAKTAGALLGLGLLIVRRGLGRTGPPVGGAGAGQIAAAVGYVEAVPAASTRLEDALGHNAKELVLGTVSLVSLTFSGGSLGLAVAAFAGVRMLSEVVGRRSSWRRYEDRVERLPTAHPGDEVVLVGGDRAPLPGVVTDGFGVATGAEGLPIALSPGAELPSGARVYGGPVRAVLSSDGRFEREAGPPAPARVHDRYLAAIPLVSGAYAGLTLLMTRSLRRALTALLLVNPRPALAGEEAANRGAAARALRSGVTIAGSRPHRPIRCPDVLLVDPPRVLTEGWELGATVALDATEEAELGRLGAWISAAAGSPWGPVFPPTGQVGAVDGTFDGDAASAEIDGDRWTLEPLHGEPPRVARSELQPGDHVLVLRRLRDDQVQGLFALRPRLARGVGRLRKACARHSVRLEIIAERSPAMLALAERADAKVVAGPAHARVRALREDGLIVAVVSDRVEAARAFDMCDLAIGMSSGRTARFPARADVLAPGAAAVAALIETGARRDAAVRDVVACAIVSNAGGAVWGLRSAPPFQSGPIPGHIGGLASMAVAWMRMHGGRPSRSVAERISDPLPERWGRQPIEEVLRQFDTSRTGLTGAEAHARWSPPAEQNGHSPFLAAVLAQVDSPVMAVLGAGAVLSFAVGALADVAMIGAVVVANAVVGAKQQTEATRATEALGAMAPRTARVIREGADLVVPAGDVVPGDLIVLSPGERVAADARVIEARALEVDEAALTGESFPVSKSADVGTEAARVVLEGSDVTAGTGRAVAVAVGPDTRLGSLASALEEDTDRDNPLQERMGQILWHSLPYIAGGAGIVTLSGVLWRRPLVSQLVLGASVAVAAVPEGLPLMASVAEAGVARRLARRRALVTRLPSVEALGRVDVACADKTGTLTAGRLVVSDITPVDGDPQRPAELSDRARAVLLSAALASPHRDAPDARAHPTDVAVVDAARDAGLGALAARPRDAESSFDPIRGFHAAICAGALHVKGAVEVLAPLCTRMRTGNGDQPLGASERLALLERAETLAAQGRRVLMVAQAAPDCAPEQPEKLTVLGFVGISDPLKPGVAAAVRRCAEAGVRTIMLTGDHPATARAIAREAGLSVNDTVLVASELGQLDDEELATRLEHTSVIARTTPLDKVRIVQALQRRGHVVAMTGDGVNDAPALRLADVGVAMGRRGTEVAREAADLVLADDDFSTLVEALVEGRGFWRNMRRALGLLLGGNAGEVSVMVGAGISGLPTPLTTRQVLSVNLVTDVLPAVAVAVQEPEHRNLSELRREGGRALDAPLRDEIVRRGVATAAPTLAVYLLAARAGDVGGARTVAYTSIVTTQLAQTLDMGRTEGGRPTGPVVRATVGSLAVLAASLWLPPLPAFLGLAPLSGAGAGMSVLAALAAVAIGRTLPLPTSHAGASALAAT